MYFFRIQSDFGATISDRIGEAVSFSDQIKITKAAVKNCRH